MDELILSQDGSHTVLSNKFGVSYHSKYGAIQETQTVFLDAGFRYKCAGQPENLSILEMGFGTGLNALMTLLDCPPDLNVEYHTLEAYPLKEDQYAALNYPDVLNLNDESKEAFLKMHECPSDNTIRLSTNFSFTKHLIKIEDFQTPKTFDVIYYDAFAPTSQEELWTEDMMQHVAKMCNPGAVLVTYCAKGSFKRALKAAGFTVEALDGPVGKREMTRVCKPS